MITQQRIVRDRRQYNQWVATETLEDYALRFTATRARKSSFRVGNTALGPIAFLACEAIGASITVSYGFQNAVWAIAAFTVLMLLIGLPIAYYASRNGVDIDLLTRGAGFGYMGSTLTSLIYASFTFLLFAFEASIMSAALNLLLHIPMALAYVISSLVVIPIAIYGISLISRMQLATQMVWLVLQFLPLLYVITRGREEIAAWVGYPGAAAGATGELTFAAFGMAVSFLLSLLPQIGEQVDYLRFLPKRTQANRLGWWSALLMTGPGWVIMGGFKILAGSFLAVFALRHGVSVDRAVQPTDMYLTVFRATVDSPTVAVVLVGVFVIVCQLKINSTNAYAGSIAWSNFFSRLTHAHPGRVVWLVFNVIIALLLLEMGILRVIDGILRIYANFAAGWLGAVAADLVISKPLGWSPPGIEFKRAYLYDINPVGVGALLASVAVSSLAYLGMLGSTAQILSPFVGLSVAFFVAPLIAWATGGRYYLAREPRPLPGNPQTARCTICENVFEGSDIALCPAYSGPICSLCCTLEARCRDMCKEDSRFTQQLMVVLRRLIPASLAARVAPRAGQFVGLLLAFCLSIGLMLAFIFHQYSGVAPAAREVIRTTLWLVFLAMGILSGITAWLIVLSHESRRAAEMESQRQTAMLMEEIEAHNRTDAALQKAKDAAEAANVAKTRYIVGMSHEIRTPLNSIFGYAQLLERSSHASMEGAVRVIRRSAEHLADLVDGLLDISRIENGLLRLNRDTLHLPDFLDQIVDMFRLQAAAKGITFHYNPPCNLPVYVHSDRKRLRQILINLLSNAVKYTEAGSTSLTVRYRSQVMEFEIADTGMGIHCDDLERIFEPFERGSAPAVRAIPGTGLGLTITKLLTQIMGGELLMRSEPQFGTTFTVKLMLSVAQQPATVRMPLPIRGYEGPRRTVLLADDDPSHLELGRSVLEPLGFRVLLAPNGHTCVALAREHEPHLAMLDISMPDMTGWDIVGTLRAMQPSHRLRIVMVSANAHEYTPGADGNSLHDAFMMKPVDIQLMLERVGELLGLKWIHAPEGAPQMAVEPHRCVSPHSMHHLEDLYRLGRIGHVRGIESKLSQLEDDDPDAATLAAELRTLVGNFDLKRYMSVIETLRARAQRDAS
jgi:signal transduction histidine kinase/CheY-like chemotaxis protein